MEEGITIAKKVADRFGMQYPRIGSEEIYSVLVSKVFDMIMQYIPGNFRAYAYTYMTNQAKSFIWSCRKHYSTQLYGTVYDLETFRERRNDIYEIDEEFTLKIAVREILETLTDEQKKICALLQEGLSYREIAKIMGTNHMKIAREIYKLREIFKKELAA